MDSCYPVKSWKDVEKCTTCGYCKKIFENPHLLICSHTFCKPCIDKQDFKMCPFCPVNNVIPLKLVVKKNLFLSRLTEIFIKREVALTSKCTNCKSSMVFCKRCNAIGCTICNKAKKCIDLQAEHDMCSIDTNAPPDCLLKIALSQFCKVHTDKMVTNYCFKCDTVLCSDCHNSKDHKTESLINIKEEVVTYFLSLKCTSTVQQTLHEQTTFLLKQKDLLYEKYVAKLTETEQFYTHKIHNEKQIILSKLMAFWKILLKQVQDYKSEIEQVQKILESFYGYYAFMTENSSNEELVSYYKMKERQFCVHNNEQIQQTVTTLKRKIKSSFGEKHIADKLKEVKDSAIRCTRTYRSNTNLPLKQDPVYIRDYQRLICEDEIVKTDEIQIELCEEKHSIFVLPHSSSKAVQNSKQQLLVISKCVQCLSQLQIFLRVFSKDLRDLKLEVDVKILNDYLISSNNDLLSVTNDAIENIQVGIMHLLAKKFEMYFTEVNKNFMLLDTFVNRSDVYYSTLDKFYHELQLTLSNQNSKLTKESQGICLKMLLDIVIDCCKYITHTKQICKNLGTLQEFMEIVCREKQVQAFSVETKYSEFIKQHIASHGFQLQMVVHYSTWVAIKEICKSNKDLIYSWIN